MNVKRIAKMTLAMAAVAMMTANANAVSTSFMLSEGVQPTNVGTITLSQVSANTVNVLLDLTDTTLPAPNYGLLNTGGPHTPFTFTLAGSETGVTASFVQPSGGIFSFGILSLNLGGGSATPFGTYGVAIDSSAGNGSGNAYYGDLEFNLTRTSGLLVSDFIANANGYYFAADLTDGGSNTGSQGWKTPTPGPTPVPDSGATLALLGMTFVGVELLRRKLV